MAGPPSARVPAPPRCLQGRARPRAWKTPGPGRRSGCGGPSRARMQCRPRHPVPSSGQDGGGANRSLTGSSCFALHSRRAGARLAHSRRLLGGGSDGSGLPGPSPWALRGARGARGGGGGWPGASPAGGGARPASRPPEGGAPTAPKRPRLGAQLGGAAETEPQAQRGPRGRASVRAAGGLREHPHVAGTGARAPLGQTSEPKVPGVPGGGAAAGSHFESAGKMAAGRTRSPRSATQRARQASPSAGPERPPPPAGARVFTAPGSRGSPGPPFPARPLRRGCCRAPVAARAPAGRALWPGCCGDRGFGPTEPGWLRAETASPRPEGGAGAGGAGPPERWRRLGTVRAGRLWVASEQRKARGWRPLSLQTARPLKGERAGWACASQVGWGPWPGRRGPRPRGRKGPKGPWSGVACPWGWGQEAPCASVGEEGSQRAGLKLPL